MTEAGRPGSVVGSEEPVVIGRVSGVFGTRGWLRVHSYTRPFDNLLQYSPWLLSTADGWREHRLAEARRHHGSLIVSLGEITDRTAAARLVHADIAVRRAQLGETDDGEYFWIDLIGLAVENLQGDGLGQVHGLFETAAHDVLDVRGEDGRRRLIPFVRDVYVMEIDLDSRSLVVDWHPDD